MHLLVFHFSYKERRDLMSHSIKTAVKSKLIFAILPNCSASRLSPEITPTIPRGRIKGKVIE